LPILKSKKKYDYAQRIANCLFFRQNWGLTFSAVGGKICATEKSSAQKGDC